MTGREPTNRRRVKGSLLASNVVRMIFPRVEWGKTVCTAIARVVLRCYRVLEFERSKYVRALRLAPLLRLSRGLPGLSFGALLAPESSAFCCGSMRDDG